MEGRLPALTAGLNITSLCLTRTDGTAVSISLALMGLSSLYLARTYETPRALVCVPLFVLWSRYSWLYDL